MTSGRESPVTTKQAPGPVYTWMFCLAPHGLSQAGLTLALNPGHSLLLLFTYFLILGVYGCQKGEQHGNAKLL